MSLLYSQSSEVISKWLLHYGGIKNLSYSNNIVNKSVVFKLASETLKYRVIIEQIIASSKGLKKKAEKFKISNSLLLVVIYDILFGSGKISGGGIIKKFMIEFKDELSNELVKLMKSKNIKNKVQLLPLSLQIDHSSNNPRYIRVNTIRITVKKAIDDLIDNNFIFLKQPKLCLESNEFYIDINMEYILVFSNKSNNLLWHKHEMVEDGRLILQDKASCMPPYVLLQDYNFDKSYIKSDVEVIANNAWIEFTNYCKKQEILLALDACSAPGNKTSFLAALFQERQELLCKNGTLDYDINKIYGCEIDKSRFQLLETMMKKAGADLVEPKNVDFLKLSPIDESFRNVNFMVVDPTCSSSGLIHERLDQRLKWAYPTPKLLESEAKKVINLGVFQASIVSHAMSFPSLVRITYSTCSVNNEENEDVVKRVLELHPEFELIPALPSWSNRGLDVIENGNYCIRCDPLKDGTHGFFVALFQRKDLSTYIPNFDIIIPSPVIEAKEVKVDPPVVIIKNDDETDEKDEDTVDENKLESTSTVLVKRNPRFHVSRRVKKLKLR